MLMNLEPIIKGLQGKGAASIILLAVLDGGYLLSSRALDAFDTVAISIDVLSKNVEDLKISVIRLGDVVVVVKEKLDDHEVRIRQLEHKRSK